MSKIKLVPCPKITKRELMTALMEGRKFTTKDKVKDAVKPASQIHWDDKFGNNPVREGLRTWEWRGFKYLHELVEQQWYGDPDMIGKAMRVRDAIDREWCVDIFHSYSGNEDSHPFIGAISSWKIAQPLTAADLYQGGE